MCKLSSILTENNRVEENEAKGNSRNRSNARNIVKYPVKKRAFSKRSRTGCLTCRHRRIKCDERKPFCFNCEKSKKTCSGFDHVKKLLMKSHLNNEIDKNDTNDNSDTNESNDNNNNDDINDSNGNNVSSDINDNNGNSDNNENNNKLPISILPIIIQSISPDNQYIVPAQLNDTALSNDSINSYTPIIYYSQPTNLNQFTDRDRNLISSTKTFSNGYDNGYSNGYINGYGFNNELQMLSQFQQIGQFNEPVQRYSFPPPYPSIPLQQQNQIQPLHIQPHVLPQQLQFQPQLHSQIQTQPQLQSQLQPQLQPQLHPQLHPHLRPQPYPQSHQFYIPVIPQEQEIIYIKKKPDEI